MTQTFPKIRPDLPPAYAAVYERHYVENRGGITRAASLSQRMEAWLHRSVARDTKAYGPRSTLEIGAGNLNQLPYEPAGSAYDIIEPMEVLYQDSPHRSRVREAFRSIYAVPLGQRYSRITSCAALEHICDLPNVLDRAIRLLESGGVFRASIPSEGGMLWKCGWMFTTGLEFRIRYGLDYGVVMRHEHVNTAREIEALIKERFAKVRISTFGVGRQLSLYRFIEATNPYRSSVALSGNLMAAE